MTAAEVFLKQAVFRPVGESAISVSFGDSISPEILRCTTALMAALKTHPFPGIREYLASYTGVTIFYDPRVLRQLSRFPESPEGKGYLEAQKRIRELVSHIVLSDQDAAPLVRIPICYGGELGPDLEEVARLHAMTPEEVIRLHSMAEYLVYMIGFAPGYPYLGGLPEALATPRRKTPRLVIPRGSVAIGGSQAGIYPLESPGGWHLLGRTPLSLFNAGNSENPTLLHAGDHVRFYPISRQEYDELAAREES